MQMNRCSLAYKRASQPAAAVGLTTMPPTCSSPVTEVPERRQSRKAAWHTAASEREAPTINAPQRASLQLPF